MCQQPPGAPFLQLTSAPAPLELLGAHPTATGRQCSCSQRDERQNAAQGKSKPGPKVSTSGLLKSLHPDRPAYIYGCTIPGLSRAHQLQADHISSRLCPRHFGPRHFFLWLSEELTNPPLEAFRSGHATACGAGRPRSQVRNLTAPTCPQTLGLRRHRRVSASSQTPCAASWPREGCGERRRPAGGSPPACPAAKTMKTAGTVGSWLHLSALQGGDRAPRGSGKPLRDHDAWWKARCP